MVPSCAEVADHGMGQMRIHGLLRVVVPQPERVFCKSPNVLRLKPVSIPCVGLIAEPDVPLSDQIVLSVDDGLRIACGDVQFLFQGSNAVFIRGLTHG